MDTETSVLPQKCLFQIVHLDSEMLEDLYLVTSP